MSSKRLFLSLTCDLIGGKSPLIYTGFTTKLDQILFQIFFVVGATTITLSKIQILESVEP